jgi:hypothetical protein
MGQIHPLTQLIPSTQPVLRRWSTELFMALEKAVASAMKSEPSFHIYRTPASPLATENCWIEVIFWTLDCAAQETQAEDSE